MFELEQEEFEIQGINFDALFVHEVNKNVHLGIREEAERFIVFCIEDGTINFSSVNVWDDFQAAHKDFMKLYEDKKNQNPLLALIQEPTRFREWLSDKYPTDIVGDFSTLSNDPIANFIKDNGFVSAKVEAGYVNVMLDDEKGWCFYDADEDFDDDGIDVSGSVPKWINRFQSYILDLDVQDSYFNVTASYALHIMNLLFK